MESELRKLDEELSVSEPEIVDYMYRASMLTREVMEYLEEQKRSIDEEIAAIREPQEHFARRGRKASQRAEAR